MRTTHCVRLFLILIGHLDRYDKKDKQMLNKKVKIIVRYLDDEESEETEYFIIPELSERFTDYQIIPSIKERIFIDPPMVMKSINENDHTDYEAYGPLKVVEVAYGTGASQKSLEVVIDTRDYYYDQRENNQKLKSS